MRPELSLFQQNVLEIIKTIPPGKVLTYGRVAALAGFPRHARLTGWVLRHAEEAANCPCHRVVNNQGRLAPNWTEQRQLLEKEGVTFKKNGCVEMKTALWSLEQLTF